MTRKERRHDHSLQPPITRSVLPFSCGSNSRQPMSLRQSGGESSSSSLPPSKSTGGLASSASMKRSSPVVAVGVGGTDVSSLSSKKHRLHLQQSLQEHVSAGPSAFAQAQLHKMGWTAGQGLGRNHTGISTHVKVSKRRDETAGLGVEQLQRQQVIAESQNEWWKDSLGATLAKLSSKSKKRKNASDHKSFTDEQLFEATGGARFGMRAAPTKNLGKWKRVNDPGVPSTTTETDSEVADSLPPLRESTVSCSSEEEEAVQEEVAPTAASPNMSDKEKKRKRSKKDKKMKKEKKTKRSKKSQP